MGESPVWDSESGALFWIDLFGPSVSSSSAAEGAVTTWALPSMPGCVALTPGGDGLVVALESGIAHLDLATGTSTLMLDAPYDDARFRFNDGRCDPAGRLWLGTNRQPGSRQPRGSAAFYRWDERGLARVVEGVTIANGLAFSPDGSTMYLAETTTDSVWAFDYDVASGSPSGRRLFAQLEGGAMPDGAAVDEDGCYWIALYGAGLVVKFTPDGRRDRVLETPVPHPTMVAFGGADSATMFLTSGRQLASPETLASHPLAGGVFCTDVGSRGVPEPRFRHLPPIREEGSLGREVPVGAADGEPADDSLGQLPTVT
jgi:L-arabinonolactonase